MKPIIFFMLAIAFSALGTVFGARAKKAVGDAQRMPRLASRLFIVAALLLIVAGGITLAKSL